MFLPRRADIGGVTAARTRLTAWRAGVLLAGGWLVFVAPGCVANVPPRATLPASARLTIANRTEHAWRVVLHPKAGGQDREVRLTARETLTLDVVAGAYAIEQAFAGATTPAQVRRLEAEFEAGERYDWPLATVRSVAEAP